MATKVDFYSTYGLKIDQSAAGDNTLSVDYSNNRVGIQVGANSPRTSLDVGYATDAIVLPRGTDVQRPGVPVGGMFRFNTTTSTVEAYNGTSWVTQSTPTINNDTTTSTAIYPSLLTTISGSLSALYTSSPNFTFVPSTGTLSSTRITLSGTTDSTTTATGTLVVSGGTGIALQLRVGGATTLSSTLAVTGATTLSSTLGVSGVTSITNTTASTTSANGALVVSGGTGIGGALRVGGVTVLTGALTVNNTATISGITTISNTTDSSGSGVGALVVSGGIGVAKSVSIGGDLTVTGKLSVTQIDESSITTLYTYDNFIELGRINNQVPSSTTTYELGLAFNYFTTSAKQSAILWKDNTGFLFASEAIIPNSTQNANNPDVTNYTTAPVAASSVYVGTDFTSNNQVIDSSKNVINCNIDCGSY